MVVDLPGPFGPRKPVTTPWGDREAQTISSAVGLLLMTLYAAVALVIGGAPQAERDA